LAAIQTHEVGIILEVLRVDL